MVARTSAQTPTIRRKAELHWPPKDGAAAPSGAGEGEWVDVPLDDAQRRWAVEQSLSGQRGQPVQQAEGQWVDVPLDEEQQRWAALDAQERRAVPADQPSPRIERPSPPIEEPLMAARQPSPVTAAPPSPIAAPPRYSAPQMFRSTAGQPSPIADRPSDLAPQMLRSTVRQPPALPPSMLRPEPLQVDLQSRPPQAAPQPAPPQLQTFPEWLPRSTPDSLIPSVDYGSVGYQEGTGGPGMAEAARQAGTMIKDVTVGRPEEAFTGETGFEKAMGGLDLALLPFMVVPGVGAGVRGAKKLMGRLRGAGRGGPPREAAETLAESAAATRARLERGEATPVIGALERFRPLHARRQKVYEKGEKVGGHIVEGMSWGLDKMLGLAEPLVDWGAKGLTSRGAPWRGLRSELGTGRWARTRELQDIQRAHRGEKAAADWDLSALGDRLIRLLPDRESQILARKISENKATPEELARAMNNPGIQEAAELVRAEFKKIGEEFIRGGVGPYSALGREGREGLVRYLQGDMSLDDLSRQLSKDYSPAEIKGFTETSVARLYGQYSPRLYETMEFTAEQIKELGSYIQDTHRVTRSQFEAALTTNRLKKRKDLPQDVREALGEIETIIYPAMKGIQQSKRVIANNRMFQSLLDTPGLVAQTDDFPDYFQKLPDRELLGPLAGRNVHPAVYRDLLQLTDVPTEGAKFLRRANAFIKRNLTVRNPATHVGNIQTNWILADLGGMDFTDQFVWNMASLARYIQEGPHWRKALEDGLFSSNYTQIDLDPRALSGLDANPADIKIPKGVGEDSITGSFGVAQKMIDVVKYADDKATALYRLEDDIPKFAMYNWLVDAKGYTSKDAVNRVHQVFPDYGDVAPIVERMRGNILAPTFVTFQSKALPFMAASFIKHPLRAGKYTLLSQTVSTYAMASLLEEERLEEKAFLPEQMRPYQGPFGMEFGAYPRMPGTDPAGRARYLDIRRLLVGSELGGGTGIPLPGIGPLPDIFDLGIIPSTAVQAVTNQDLYQSRLRGEPVEITDWRVTEGVPHRTATEQTQDLMNFIGQQTLPSLTPPLPGPLGEFWEGGRNWQRIQRAREGTPDYTGEPQSMESALGQALAGFRTIPIDPRQQERYRAMDIRGGIQDIQDDLRSDAFKFSTGQITEKELEESKQETLDRAKRIMEAWRALQAQSRGEEQ